MLILSLKIAFITICIVTCEEKDGIDHIARERRG